MTLIITFIVSALSITGFTFVLAWLNRVSFGYAHGNQRTPTAWYATSALIWLLLICSVYAFIISAMILVTIVTEATQ